jgi:hypothetical protein
LLFIGIYAIFAYFPGKSPENSPKYYITSMIQSQGKRIRKTFCILYLRNMCIPTTDTFIIPQKQTLTQKQESRPSRNAGRAFAI